MKLEMVDTPTEEKIEMVNEEIKPTGELRQIAKTSNRFTIVRTDGYGYKVSIPNYEGGEVVKADAYDVLHTALRRIEAGSRFPENEYMRTVRDVARAALALVDGPQNQETK